MLKYSLRRIVEFLGYRVDRSDQCDVFDAYIHRFLKPRFTFVQIGANDGRRFDPIFKYVSRYRWKGLAVEPIAEYFDELRETYKNNPNVVCCRCAVFEEERPVTLYRIKPDSENLPEWTKGIASLLPHHHDRSQISPSDIVAETAPGVPLSTLLVQYGISSIDLMQIDAEGYDYQIVKMIDFENNAPNILRFEHGVHDNVMTDGQLIEIVEILIHHGYEVHLDLQDCYAAKLAQP